MKEKWIKKWQNLSFLSKIAHLSVIMLALFAPFVSLVVEGLFNIYIVEQVFLPNISFMRHCKRMEVIDWNIYHILCCVYFTRLVWICIWVIRHHEMIRIVNIERTVR